MSPADSTDQVQSDERRFGVRKRIWALAGGALVIGVVGWVAWQGFYRYKVWSLRNACETAKAAGDWGNLELLAYEWTAWQPRNAQAWLYAAEAAESQGELLRQAIFLRNLPDDDPRSVTALLQLSHLQFGVLNQPLRGAATCQRILAIDPKHSEAHRRLIFFYAMTRQRSKMIAEARRAIEIGCDTPETYMYLVGADWIAFSNGYDVNRRWFTTNPDSELLLVAGTVHRVRSATLDETADTPSENGTSQHTENEKLMRDLAKVYPQNLEVLAFHLNRATFRGQQDRAAELLAKVPATAADDSRFWRYKGWLHESRGELGEAETAYRKSLELFPYDWHAQHALASVLRRKMQFDEVEVMQRRAMLGKELMSKILQSPSTDQVDVGLLKLVAEYAEQCADMSVAKHLRQRIAKMETSAVK